MGTYTSLTLGGYDLHPTKSYAESSVLTIFRESDRFHRVVRIDDSGKREVVRSWGQVSAEANTDDESNANAADYHIEIGYSAPVWVIRDRLDVMGFTLAAATDHFDRGIAAEVEKYRGWSEFDDEASWLEEIALLTGLTFAEWLIAMTDLRRRSIYGYQLNFHENDQPAPVVSSLQEYMLDDHFDHWYGYPLVDLRFFLRAALETCDSAELVEQDLGGVIAAGYYKSDEQIADNARVALLNDFPANAPIIVLTEGSTDRRIIESSLQLLYPHIAPYFSFMDFEATGSQGGTGSLMATVKAFAGAGIANRTVALFDNDTAGHNAVRTLARITLPPTIRAMTLPALQLAASYPTIGPSGKTIMDVNGLAASIELYFGEDVLTGSDGLVPVQWRGYDAGMRRYQGEVLDKPLLQERFASKMLRAQAEPATIEIGDWTGMRAILDALREAFSEGPSAEATA